MDNDLQTIKNKSSNEQFNNLKFKEKNKSLTKTKDEEGLHQCWTRAMIKGIVQDNDTGTAVIEIEIPSLSKVVKIN